MIDKYVELIKNKTSIIPRSVLEIGSRDGKDANFFKEKFNIKPDKVYIVEPNPTQAKKIKIEYPEYKLFEFAVYKENAELDFFEVYDEDIDPIGISSLLDRNDDWYSRFKTRKIKINAITGENLLSMINHEIDICKIDVEGATFEVLESFGEKIKNINSFHVETEKVKFWKNQKLHLDVCEFISGLGYIAIWSDNGEQQVDTVWVKKEKVKL
jgi:FkbM family methyltransferase